MRGSKIKASKRRVHRVSPVGRSVFHDLFAADEATVMEMRAQLLIGLEQWLERNEMTKAEAADVLGITQARLSDLKRGKVNRFSMDLLVRLAARAGLKPSLRLVL